MYVFLSTLYLHTAKISIVKGSVKGFAVGDERKEDNEGNRD